MALKSHFYRSSQKSKIHQVNTLTQRLQSRRPDFLSHTQTKSAFPAERYANADLEKIECLKHGGG